MSDLEKKVTCYVCKGEDGSCNTCDGVGTILIRPYRVTPPEEPFFYTGPVTCERRLPNGEVVIWNDVV